MSELLQIKNLQIEYAAQRGKVRAVDGISFSLQRGEIFGLAGESGCGKSTTAFGICRLLRPPAQIVGGSIKLDGLELTQLSEEQFDHLRWSRISIVLQSAMNNLNPVMRIGPQLMDAILAHQTVTKVELEQRVLELLDLVDLPRDRILSYPHELSGGMRQRVVIAMALALKPDLIIMDEPTTALDVVVQSGIIKKVVQLQKRFGFSILFITHDLPLMLEICDRIGIMYAGKLIEIMDRSEMLRGPRHPYTQGLLESFPSLEGEKRRLHGIPGFPPDLITPPAGCRFHPRCPQAQLHCRLVQPPTIKDSRGLVSCHLYTEEGKTLEQASVASEGSQ